MLQSMKSLIITSRFASISGGTTFCVHLCGSVNHRWFRCSSSARRAAMEKIQWSRREKHKIWKWINFHDVFLSVSSLDFFPQMKLEILEIFAMHEILCWDGKNNWTRFCLFSLASERALSRCEDGALRALEGEITPRNTRSFKTKTYFGGKFRGKCKSWKQTNNLGFSIQVELLGIWFHGIRRRSQNTSLEFNNFAASLCFYQETAMKNSVVN